MESLIGIITNYILGARADSSIKRYSRAFEKFRLWAAGYKEINALPCHFLSVATYLESSIQSNCSFSATEAAFYGIRWAHNLYGFHNPCESIFVKGVLGSAKRSLSKPVVKKQPVSPDMILAICDTFACVNANLSDLRAATICVTAYPVFLRFDELVFFVMENMLRCS